MDTVQPSQIVKHRCVFDEWKNMRATAQELEQILRVGRRSRQMLLTTVNETGELSFTPVQECRLTDETRVSIKAWTDIPLPENTGGHDNVALLIWNTSESRGYQLGGHTVRSRATAVLDGYAEIEEHEHFPQVQREILMEVDSIQDLRFGARESWYSDSTRGEKDESGNGPEHKEPRR